MALQAGRGSPYDGSSMIIQRRKGVTIVANNGDVLGGFFRFSGWMLLLAGVTMAFVQYVHLEDVPSGMEQMGYFVDVAVWTHVALFLSCAMFVLGFAGLYIRQAAGMRWWGWLSYVLLVMFFLIDNNHSVLQIYTYPYIFGDVQTEEQLEAASDLAMNMQMHDGPGMILMFLLMPLILFGQLLMGFSMLKARILSKWPAIVNLVLVIFIFIPYGPFSKYLFPIPFLIYAWYGAILAFEKRNAAIEPAVNGSADSQGAQTAGG